MSTVESTSDVWWRFGDDKVALGLYIAFGVEFGFVEAFLLPPVVPGRLDDRGDVGFVVGIV